MSDYTIYDIDFIDAYNYSNTILPEGWHLWRIITSNPLDSCNIDLPDMDEDERDEIIRYELRRKYGKAYRGYRGCEDVTDLYKDE